eukprot:TRINITY_DN89290_c0_g1_i1.p1 TRINITY_DN89290_c0_g1~~TRINITY_DN89290_c0_g1_i1.p1  ORF type:complete len:216 (+),score=25.90 TRINITY_DN89290_c0_g1_i1:71-718(+)
MANDAYHHPSALRNRGPILEALQGILHPDVEGWALEIASGSGCHVEHFAPAFPKLQWQPSEFARPGEEQVLRGIDAVGCASLRNVLPAVAVDASLDWTVWPTAVTHHKGSFVLVYTSNVTHISPWPVTLGIVAAAGQALVSGGHLIIYGPFKVDGYCTTESNASFDSSLRARDPQWGYRDVADVASEAAEHGLELQERREMPANNFLLVFRKTRD